MYAVGRRGELGKEPSRVPSPDPIFPEGSGYFYWLVDGCWNEFILLGPKPSELVLQTGRVSAHSVTDGKQAVLAVCWMGEAQSD